MAGEPRRGERRGEQMPEEPMQVVARLEGTMTGEPTPSRQR